MEVKYTADSELSFTLPFACGSCGISTTGTVLGKGTGSTSAKTLKNDVFEQDYHGELAREKARESARRDAEALMKLAPCPKCKVQDPVAVKANAVGPLTFVVFIAICAGLGALAGIKSGDYGFTIGLGVFVGAMLGLISVAVAREKVKRAKAIRFM